MGPRANVQPHVPTDWPPESESTLHFELEADVDDKIFLAGIETWMSNPVILLPIYCGTREDRKTYVRADSGLLVIFSLRSVICVNMGRIFLYKTAFYSKYK